MFDPRWQKVINDLWNNKSRTALVVMAIAVGVFAFGSVFISREVLLEDMNTMWQSTSPSSISMYVSPFDEGLVQAVRGMRDVADADGQIVYGAKLIRGDEEFNVDLYAMRDFKQQRIDLLTPESGAWPPGRRQILLERTAVPIVGVSPGDMILIELPDGQQRALEFAGTVYSPTAIPASMFPQLSAYVSVETLRWLGHSGMYNRLAIATDPSITDLEEIDTIATTIKERIGNDGYTVGTYVTQDPTEHWGAPTTKAFTSILAGVGVFSLALSGFLVINTISAVLIQHKRQIGMMKAVGATGGQVTLVYLAMVGIFGLLALVVALPVGLGLAYVMTAAVTQFLNTDILNFHIPPWVLALEVGAALFAPMVAALFPILGGTRVTVREAISDYGIGTRRHRGWFERMLAHIRGLPRPTLLSLRNTFRRKGRLFLTLGALTLAGSIFIAIINVRASMLGELFQILKLFQYDIEVSLGDAYQTRRLEREALKVPGVEGAEGRMVARAQYVQSDGDPGAFFIVFGIPHDSAFTTPTMLEGRWLEEGDQNAIALSSTIAVNQGLGVGDEITLLVDDVRRHWTVVGIFSSFGQNDLAYADYDYLARLRGIPGQSFYLYIATAQHDGASQAEAAAALSEHYKSVGIEASQYNTGDEVIKANVGQIEFMVAFLLALAILIAVVGGLGLAGTMSLNVLERTREIGVMRATGASNGMVRGIVLTEGLLIGVMSWAMSILLSFPMTLGFNAAVGQAILQRPAMFVFAPLGLLMWLGLVVVISLVACLVPARRAVRISVRETLAYQ